MQCHEEAVQLVTHVIEKNGWIDLPAEGTSMFPFIKTGDICRFISCESSRLNKGDIFLFRTSIGSLVAHRYHYSKSMDQKVLHFFKGDTNLGYDEAIGQDQIIGKLAWVQRNHTNMRSELSAHLWGRVILLHPIVSRILRMYLNKKRSNQA